MKVAARGRLWGPLALFGATAVALAAASQAPALAPRGALGSLAPFAVALAVATAAGMHRPFAGSGLGLGTLALPPAFTLLGALPAALAAGGAVAAIELVHRALARGNPALPPSAGAWAAAWWPPPRPRSRRSPPAAPGSSRPASRAHRLATSRARWSTTPPPWPPRPTS